MKKFILGDCMNTENGLPSLPDAKDAGRRVLAIVDPPYGIGVNAMNMGTGRKRNKYTIINHKYSNWDNQKPDKEYFVQLFRVANIVMVWGGNYFTDFLPPSKHWVIWDKNFHFNLSFNQFEMCWQSEGRGCRIFKHNGGTNGNNVSNNRRLALQYTRIHPTQKPIALYLWLLENYAQPGDLILDTHVGSASSLIACEQMGFDYIAWEKDADYYAAAKNRMSKGIQGLIKFDI